MIYNRKSIDVITPPASQIISTADMKTYLRVDGSSDDSMIDDMILAATDSMKRYLRRSLLSETLELTMDFFSTQSREDGLLRLGAGVHIGHYASITGYSNEFDLPYSPIQSITSIKYFTKDNTENTFSSANYNLDGVGGRIYLDEGQTFPTDLRARAAVKVRYVAGYGDDPSDVPAPIMQAIKSHVANMYDCRDACGDIPKLCKDRVSGYKRHDSLGF